MCARHKSIGPRQKSICLAITRNSVDESRIAPTRTDFVSPDIDVRPPQIDSPPLQLETVPTRVEIVRQEPIS
jgi:hypothetical protein